MDLCNKRAGLLGALIATASLVLSGCGGGAGASGTEGGPKEIRILVSAPLTGDSAETGKDLVDGAKLAADHLNEQGGVRTGALKGAKFVIESADDQMKTEAATTIAARFAAEDDIFALTGFLTSGQAQAAGVVLAKYKLPAVVSFASADFLTTDADNLVVVSASVANFARVAGAFVGDKLNAKTVGTIAGDYSFLDSYYKGLTDSLTKGGTTIASKQSYPDGTADFSTMITSLAKANPDVVMSGAFQADAGKIAAQAGRAGLKKPFVDFLGEGWGKTFADSAGSVLEDGEYYQMDPAKVFPQPGSLLDTLDKRFLKEYGKNIPTAAMHSFDSVLSVAAAIEAGATEKTDLLTYMTKAKGEGLLGPISFTQDLTPNERFGTMSKVTGPGPRDREQAASYLMHADGTVEPAK
ncbi:branched-chain amino acid ABC transporter substrate-binding protein [Spongiactinospora sp. TRM90649]|uniref:ABC transporter substrate-binding protein n=1 Tax=Spongiactinospora sp. TRM90649 TaxID=3031114 RepID=UPI0023F9D555|nr:branched-chain amino acid ABC transporter substrate-binding protein [Spongiactinospora sp. TRM90649]MDF5758304.1 branched-chain amino acid ABC transporter substrate-binding protein [Spongiactinospora sp. TRM90649]